MKIPDAPEVELVIDGKTRIFDLDDPQLPDWIEKNSLQSGGFPYARKMKSDPYKEQLQALQEELVKVLYWLQDSGERVLAIFEGRDAAGKGGTISRIRENVNPRHVRGVALDKPSDAERGQWYFQRYVAHFPTAGEMVLFDRSWYNRAGVEPVMGFCTAAQHQAFLEGVPHFEAIVRRDGIHFFKFWLNISREMQLKRFHERRHDPVKVWKLSPVDIRAISKWDEYTKARDLAFEYTDRPEAPWTVIRANDKRRARLNAIRVLLHALDYAGKDAKRIGKIDREIVRPAAAFSD